MASVAKVEGGRRRGGRGGSRGFVRGWVGEVVREGDEEGVQFPRLVIGAASSGSKNSIYK